MPAHSTALPGRLVTLACGFALLAGACGSNGPAGPTLASLARGATEVSLVQAQSSLATGTSRFVFGLIPTAAKPREGGSPEV